MSKKTSIALLLAITFALPFTLHAKCRADIKGPSASKVAVKTTVSAHAANSAAYTLLATMNMKESYEGMIKRITQMQIQANPQLKAIEPTIHAFFTKYMGWEAQRGDIAALYAKNYTTEELKELNKFYQTPLGQKTVQLMPQLAAASAQIGQSKMMAHMPEMKAMIESELKKVSAKK
ncbi:MAG TPA: DUF2059 domain-containing protein [Sulfurovum sp.]|nr:DUF2059 domain-containing protein [Sulfurovum sp.]